MVVSDWRNVPKFSKQFRLVNLLARDQTPCFSAFRLSTALSRTTWSALASCWSSVALEADVAFVGEVVMLQRWTF